MAKATTDTCCLTLPLKLEKWQEDRLDKRLEIARKIYNTLVNFELKKLRKLEANSDYIALQEKLKETTNNTERKNCTRRLTNSVRKPALRNMRLSRMLKHFISISMPISALPLPFTELHRRSGLRLIACFMATAKPFTSNGMAR